MYHRGRTGVIICTIIQNSPDLEILAPFYHCLQGASDFQAIISIPYSSCSSPLVSTCVSPEMRLEFSALSDGKATTGGL